jgi:hypothetical protein
MRGLDGCGRVKINPVTQQPTLYNYTGDACNRSGWFDSIAHDIRFLMNCGPLTMNSLDTQIIVLAAVIGRGTNNFQSVCQVQSLSDSALKYYYSDFVNCPPLGIQSLSNEVPGAFRLHQNYPNPFNPVTTIQFTVPLNKGGERGLYVKLIVYDLLGREAAGLVNDKLQPGTYEVEWDAAGFPSGVYFYVLNAGDYSETKKMVVLK